MDVLVDFFLNLYTIKFILYSFVDVQELHLLQKFYFPWFNDTMIS